MVLTQLAQKRGGWGRGLESEAVSVIIDSSKDYLPMHFLLQKVSTNKTVTF